MDHSLPSPRTACSFEQSLYSPGGALKQPPEYDCAASTSYYNPPSCSSLPPEDSVKIETFTAPTPPAVMSHEYPSFTALLEEDEDVHCGVYQQVSDDTPSFATLNPVLSLHDVVNFRNDLQPVDPNQCMNVDIYSNKMGDCKAYTEELSPSQSENLDLALETLREECEGKPQFKTEYVKTELKQKIRRKRSLAGLKDVDLSDPKRPVNEMTELDIDRKERRKASNRKAAAKCRKKKIEEQASLAKAKEDLDAKVEQLQQENARLKQLLALCSCPQVKKALIDISASQGISASGSLDVPKPIPKSPYASG